MLRTFSIVILYNVAAIALAVSIYVCTGEKMLGESGFLTKLSGAQLLAISVITFAIFRIRNREIEKVFSLKNPRIVWALISAGFLFLMADELFKIHEGIDAIIQSTFNLKQSGVTDRINDLLVVAYALIGIGVIWIYRREFLVMKRSLAFMASGFGMLLVMVALDMLTSRDDVLRVVFSADLATDLQIWLSFAEEGAKVLSEGLFVIAFYTGLQNLK